MIEYHKTKYGVLYDGKSDNVLRCLDPESVDCCITSPPYWGLRDYGTASWVGGDTTCDHIQIEHKHCGERKDRSQKAYTHKFKQVCGKCGAVRVDDQIGLEPTPEEYVDNLVKVFREVKRVLKKDGVLWLNLGDSYASNGCYLHTWMDKHPEKKHLHTKNSERYKDVPAFRGGEYNIKPKDLVGIPWRVAFALQADGWYLRQDIIWHKPNPMPESVTDRCTKSHEYVFLMSKCAKYYFDNQAIKEPSTTSTKDRLSQNIKDQVGSDRVPFKKNGNMKAVGGEFRNKRSVWTVNTRPYKGAHFATYPPELIRPMIKTTRPNAVILDPFVGSGTTAIVAIENGRSYVGIDLNKAYLDIASSQIDSLIDQTEIALDGVS